MGKAGRKPRNTALLAGSLLAGFKVLEWHLVEVIGPFAVSVVGITLWVAFFAVLLGAAVYLLTNVRKKGLTAAVPAIILAMAFVIAWLAPLSNFVLEANFRVNLTAREQVVAMVQSGKLADPSLPGEILLPDGLRHLSAGGNIHVFAVPDRVSVFFYSHRGILGCAGFAYVSDAVFGEYDFGKVFAKRTKLLDRWYYGEGYM